MIRGVLRWGLVLSIALAVSATFSVAAVPDGPRLAIIRHFPYPKSLTEIATVNPVGGVLQTVVRDQNLVRHEGPVGIVGFHPAFSPDGSLITFAGSTAGAHGGVESPVVAVVGADGGGLRVLRGTFTEAAPIFAPNGHTIAFSTLKVISGHFQRAGSGAQASDGVRVALGIRSVDIEDGSQRMVTPWHPWGQDAVLDPSSYSPDGSTLAVTASYFKGSTSAVAVRLDGSGSTLLAKNAEEPVYSPDGSRIALIRVHSHLKHSPRPPHRRWIVNKDLYVMRADGSGLTRLTRSPRLLEEWPSWDPSGKRIAFNSYRPGPGPLRPPSDTSVMQVNADGTCLTKVLTSRFRESLDGAAWQPGPGRGAGPIECGG